MTAEVKKKVRRGISNETQATSQLKFHEKDAAQNGLFIGIIKEAKVDWRTIGEDAKGMESFRGLAMPRFTIEFTSKHQKVEERRHVYMTLLPVESNVDTIPGGSSEWQVNVLFQTIKHILNVFVFKGREMTETEIDALTLPFEDFDDNGEYVAIDPQEVLNGYQTVFENAIAMLNGTFGLAEGETAKPAYKDAKGNPISIWMKLIRYVKNKNEWKAVSNGDLAFPRFVGEGILEIMSANANPAIVRYNPITESITPKEVKKAPNIPGAPMGTPMGGVVTPQMGGFMPESSFNSSAFAEAGEEMPF